jgi:hypothetical protein
MKDVNDTVTLDCFGEGQPPAKPRGHRPKVYASNAERQRAYRARKRILPLVTSEAVTTGIDWQTRALDAEELVYRYQEDRPLLSRQVEVLTEECVQLRALVEVLESRVTALTADSEREFRARLAAEDRVAAAEARAEELALQLDIARTQLQRRAPTSRARVRKS